MTMMIFLGTISTSTTTTTWTTVSCFTSTSSSTANTRIYRPHLSLSLHLPKSLHHHHHHCNQRSTSLFSSSSSPSSLFSSSTENDDTGNNNKKNMKERLQRLLFVLQRKVLSLANGPRRFSAKFASLSKRAKTLVVAQLLVFTLVFGNLGKTVVEKYYHPSTGAASQRAPIEVPYSSFLTLVEQSGSSSASASSPLRQSLSSGSSSSAMQVDNVRIAPDKIVFRLTRDNVPEGEPDQLMCYARQVAAQPELVDSLMKNGVQFAAAPAKRMNSVAFAARSLIVGFYMLILWRMYNSFGKNSGSGDVPGRLAKSGDGSTAQSFNDIQGIDAAKNEVMELVDTLRNPTKYSILGARAPTGLLLEGPPGTGKTMLARATAASAGVPLLYASGSDFVEMFVGRGAARVRKLFERANKLSPCIIFIDELDALGKSRDSGNALMTSRGNDEAEQTLNQLLACMDGLDSSRKVIVLAATNRREVLDPALVRPGRFDRIVKLELPDAAGRERILRVHAERLPGFEEGQGIDDKRPNSLGKDGKIDLSAIAAVTAGFSGAELEFIVNEAAIRAVRRVSSAIRDGKTSGVTPHVKAEDFEESIRNFFATRRPKDPLNDMW
eukprot:CAMPEP_0113457740 /NCGR_PEP_ID=MMETSP0014_2-20120614/9563_1 /TAXON_ID=2857 /ORGANISM="Nitzschia sp." /LENGTH=608 /DNA_ID=CAMNT_0000349243 /DNA_START=259 /DNA_END=2082 /DNA_ORIENTATION=- /assembly_acc=CAM_ASM_000159